MPQDRNLQRCAAWAGIFALLVTIAGLALLQYVEVQLIRRDIVYLQQTAHRVNERLFFTGPPAAAAAVADTTVAGGGP